MTHRQPRLLAVAVGLAVVAGACGLGGPEATVTPSTVAPEPVVYVALGGRATVEHDPGSTRRAIYPRLLFRDHLPAQTVFTDLARDGATVTAAATDQVPTAQALHPTVATVWFDGDELSGSPDEGARALDEVLSALARAGADVAVTAGLHPDAAWADAVAQAAARTGATPVDLTGVEDQSAVADRFAAALGLPD